MLIRSIFVNLKFLPICQCTSWPESGWEKIRMDQDRQAMTPPPPARIRKFRMDQNRWAMYPAMDDYPANSCAISPTAFLFSFSVVTFRVDFLGSYFACVLGEQLILLLSHQSYKGGCCKLSKRDNPDCRCGYLFSSLVQPHWEGSLMI